jgi:hypothetical protein
MQDAEMSGGANVRGEMSVYHLFAIVVLVFCCFFTNTMALFFF